MPDAAKSQKTLRTQADMRQERLAAELRTNLAKRKQQARSRAAAAKADDKPIDVGTEAAGSHGE